LTQGCGGSGSSALIQGERFVAGVKREFGEGVVDLRPPPGRLCYFNPNASRIIQMAFVKKLDMALP
jgi:hypothetical protein